MRIYRPPGQQTDLCDITNCADRMFATWGRTPEDRMAGSIGLNPRLLGGDSLAAEHVVVAVTLKHDI